MSDRSGVPVPVPDVKVGDQRPPITDLDRLTDYINKRFSVRDPELIKRQREASKIQLKGDLITLGFEAIDFRRELSGWIALARRVRDEMYAEAIDSSHGERTAEAKENQLRRADSTLVKTRAAASIAPLAEVIERLDEARTEMDKIVSWCQSLQRSVSDAEFAAMFEADHAVPEALFSAPIGAALRKLEH